LWRFYIRGIRGRAFAIPRYSCSRGWLDNGEPHCITFGGLRVDDAIADAILTVVRPGAVAAAVAAEKEAVRPKNRNDSKIAGLCGAEA